MDLADAFGKTLKKMRQDADLSQEELAFECELDRTYISLLERGRRQPSLKTIFSLSTALDADPEDMIYQVRKTAAASKS